MNEKMRNSIIEDIDKCRVALTGHASKNLFEVLYAKYHMLDKSIDDSIPRYAHGIYDANYNHELTALMAILETYLLCDSIPAQVPIVGKEENNNIVTLYDVFISHANADKIEYVNQLKESLDKLGIQIFYDKDSLEWGDKWKEMILDGVQKAEFAIIVISDNFFGREWTEKELQEFLNRQNSSGQKIILPILHNISVSQLQEQYPTVADIQALNSSDYSCDEIALKFAGQLIKRLKA